MTTTSDQKTAVYGPPRKLGPRPGPLRPTSPSRGAGGRSGRARRRSRPRPSGRASSVSLLEREEKEERRARRDARGEEERPEDGAVPGETRRHRAEEEARVEAEARPDPRRSSRGSTGAGCVRRTPRELSRSFVRTPGVHFPRSHAPASRPATRGRGGDRPGRRGRESTRPTTSATSGGRRRRSATPRAGARGRARARACRRRGARARRTASARRARDARPLARRQLERRRRGRRSPRRGRRGRGRPSISQPQTWSEGSMPGFARVVTVFEKLRCHRSIASQRGSRRSARRRSRGGSPSSGALPRSFATADSGSLTRRRTRASRSGRRSTQAGCSPFCTRWRQKVHLST